MISALRGWRRKRRQTAEEFALDFEAWVAKSNKQSKMNKVNGVSYGYPQYIHKGRKP